jgi:hypothetical protein
MSLRTLLFYFVVNIIAFYLFAKTAFLRKDLKGIIFLCFSSGISATIGLIIFLIKVQVALNFHIISKEYSLLAVAFSDDLDLISTGFFITGVFFLTKKLNNEQSKVGS